MTRPTPDTLDSYPYQITLSTRWADNDIYGHMNNAVYYFYFDTVVNRWLIERGLLELGKSEIIGLVVDTGCSYFAPIAFPDEVTMGLRVSKIGTSSVRYEIGMFRAGETTAASAQGHFVHVYVDEKTRRAVSIPDEMRATLAELCPKQTE